MSPGARGISNDGGTGGPGVPQAAIAAMAQNTRIGLRRTFMKGNQSIKSGAGLRKKSSNRENVVPAGAKRSSGLWKRSAVWECHAARIVIVILSKC
jgi:hypothetical protein